MTSDSNERVLATPAPPERNQVPSARRLRIRTEVRAGLATSLAAAALQSNKKPPAEEE
jgi:hypothetical protein